MTTYDEYRTNLLSVSLIYRALHCTALHFWTIINLATIRRNITRGLNRGFNRGLQCRQKYIYQQTVTFL